MWFLWIEFWFFFSCLQIYFWAKFLEKTVWDFWLFCIECKIYDSMRVFLKVLFWSALELLGINVQNDQHSRWCLNIGAVWPKFNLGLISCKSIRKAFQHGQLLALQRLKMYHQKISSLKKCRKSKKYLKSHKNAPKYHKDKNKLILHLLSHNNFSFLLLLLLCSAVKCWSNIWNEVEILI